MEDRVYTDVNDYLQYLTPWSQMTFVPLTYFSVGRQRPAQHQGVRRCRLEPLDRLPLRRRTRFATPGPARSRRSRSRSRRPPTTRSLKAKGTNFFSTFASFTADTAEWRDSNTPFAEGATFPDIERAASDSTGRPITLTTDGVGASGKLAHTSYVLLERPPRHGCAEALARGVDAARREDGDRARRPHRRRGERHVAAVREAAPERRPGDHHDREPGPVRAPHRGRDQRRHLAARLLADPPGLGLEEGLAADQRARVRRLHGAVRDAQVAAPGRSAACRRARAS